MKKIFAFLLFVLVTEAIFAQNQADLTRFNTERLKMNRTGMYVLGGWAIANFGTNGALLINASGENKYFYQMNIFWNLVNVGLAGSGLLGYRHDDPAGFNAFQTLDEQYSVEKVLLLNAGLDVAYISMGLWLKEKGKSPENSIQKNQLLTGYGKSLLLQGAFLLVFDASFYGVMHHHLNKNKFIFENLTFSGNAASVIIRF
ncbi:MAG: hypothetical protein H7Y04_01760 [Verrucomicrobia bacterium]|nr:hypothetical protein [Cytophagales bacterium]